jgi:hypothetical protein
MIHSIPDLTMTGAAIPLRSTTTTCNWCILSAPTANTGDLRIGDSAANATNGAVLSKGLSTLLPAIGDTKYLDLGSTYVFGTAGDKLSVLYGTH